MGRGSDVARLARRGPLERGVTLLHVVCLNVKKTNGDRLEGALATVPHRMVFHAGTGNRGRRGFDGLAGTAARFPTVEAFLEHYAGGYGPEDPVLVIAEGHGAEALRYWFLDDENREQVDAVVLVESGAEVDPDGPSGITEFARDCEAEPSEKMLVLCRPQRAGGALSGDVARGISPARAHAVGHPRGGVRVVEIPEEVDPAGDLPEVVYDVTTQVLVPFLHDLGPASSPDPLVEHLTERNIVSPSLPLGQRCVVWSKEQVRALPVPSVIVMSRWLSLTQGWHEAERGAPRLTRVWGTNPSVAAACAAAHACLLPTDELPHELRRNARELVADAARARAWFPGWLVRRRDYVPAAGDLLVFDRSQPGRPETAWWGHVERVVDPVHLKGDAAPTLLVIGTSEEPTVRWRTRSVAYDDPRLLGVVAYPREGGEWPRYVTPGGEQARLDELAEMAAGSAETAWWMREQAIPEKV